jgi:serine/threonine protein kinase
MSAGFDLPGYVDLELVGAGGYGRVFRARQPAFDRTVAIKLLTGRLDDEATLHRFQRECQALGSVSSHPNIVPVYDAGETPDGEPYLVMDFVRGGSLGDLVARSGPLPWSDVAQIGVKLAGALHSAHAAGVLHRDIKPDNILLSDYGEPQLADFGIAQKAGIENRTATSAAMTPSHASQEQFAGEPPSEVTDVYALASTLFTVLTGSSPFQGHPDESIYALIRRAMTEPPPDLRPFGVPDPLARVIEQGLSKHPGDRPPSGEALGRLLQDAQAAMGVAVTPLPIPRLGGVSSGGQPERSAGTSGPEMSWESAPPSGPGVSWEPAPPSRPGGSWEPVPPSGPGVPLTVPDRRRWYASPWFAGLAALALVAVGIWVWQSDFSARPQSNPSAAGTGAGASGGTPSTGSTPRVVGSASGDLTSALLRAGTLAPVGKVGWNPLDRETAARIMPGMPATCYNLGLDVSPSASTSLRLGLPASSNNALIQVVYRGAPDSTSKAMAGLRGTASCRPPGQVITRVSPAGTPGLKGVRDRLPGEEAIAFRVVAQGKTFYEMIFRKGELICAVVWKGPFKPARNWAVVAGAAITAARQLPSL